MLEGWKEDKENFQSADEQFAAYIKFYNGCFQVRTNRFFINVTKSNYHLTQ